jgi:hypothetical protein
MMHFQHLPTVELQTLAWMLQVRLRKEDASVLLDQGGYQVKLSYFEHLTIGERSLHGVLQLEYAYVPTELRGRDWLPRFCQLCHMMTDEAFIIKTPETPRLLVTMARWSFERAASDLWVMFYDEPKEWPFRLEV